uniref:uncharacterized protein LOC120345335 isoform X1 n=1 Tax=Styela clava TaxID=7725 RepID=UPI00193A7ED7|nr:uncharacterized protein LOC120345335 isoform X1 [Styela clava]
MEQEVRSSDIFTMLASLIDPQSGGLQSSQNNNNNSNPTIPMHISVSQADSTESQVGMSSTMLNIACQASTSNEMSGLTRSVANNGIAGMERMSAFMHSNFGNPGSSIDAICTGPLRDAIYESASHLGSVPEISSGLNSRISQYAPNTMDFTSSQNHAAIMEALNTVDTAASFPEQHNERFSQSYVSLLHQQTVTTGSGRWTGDQSSTGLTSSRRQNGNAGVSKQRVVSSRSSVVNDHHSSASNIQSTAKIKVQNSSHHFPANTEGRNMHNSENRTGRGNIESHQSANLHSIQMNPEDVIEDRSKEKKLTTTPIPSDADKSSCSSTSSGSISGPEHSPEHVTDHHVSSSRIDLFQHQVENNKKNFSNSHAYQVNQESHTASLNGGNSKNYPCYGNMNVLNFGTINFSPVMGNTATDLGNGIRPINNQNESAIASNNALSETPGENIFEGALPSSNKQTEPRVGIPGKSALSSASSYAQMQTVSVVPQLSNVSHLPSHKSKKSANIQIDPKTNTISEMAGMGSSLLDKHREKQKKNRNQKHKLVQQRSFQQEVLGLGQNILSGGGIGQSSNLKPKMNADPTKKNNPNSQSYQMNWMTQPGILPPHMNIDQLKAAGQHFSIPVSSTREGVNKPIKNSTMDVYKPGMAPKKPRQWQTVTAVQGPKLPPMLSEQDRIPKRGRPSKKMMQQNLKVKKDAEKEKPPLTLTQIPVAPKPESSQSQPTQPPTNLVSMYTINDKGHMEEIAPKVKENRRSKERTQAFLKFLDEIKSASKQQMIVNPKFSEKAKTSTEKSVKRKPRARTKVFGRPVSQPLTDSGITETMYTFSALAHQYKISSSIVERATENLLKSAALKRNKEQSSMLAVQQRTSDKNKGAMTKNSKSSNLSAASHCEMTKTSSSQSVTSSAVPVPKVAADKIPITSFKKVRDSGETRSAELISSTTSNSANKPINNSSSQNVVGNNITTTSSVHVNSNKPQIAVAQNINENENVPIVVTENAAEFSTNVNKGKHKKKKHKKHKKHKHPDISSSKKKKKDKEKKKKLKKKFKTKLGYSLTPSSSVSLVKPPTKPQLGSELDIPDFQNIAQKEQEAKSGLLAQGSNEAFSLNFRQSDRTDNSNPWQQDDIGHDIDDSSSDEASVSPESLVDRSSESFTTSASTNGLSSFAQYSNSRIGFGTFSADKSSVSTYFQDKGVMVPALVSPTADHSDSFTTQSQTQTTKKHSKHKKKKFFRKSKNICDPAFLVILDELLQGFEHLKLGPLRKQQRDRQSTSNTNVFFSIGVNDSSQNKLRIFRNITTIARSERGSNVVKGTVFNSSNESVKVSSLKPVSDSSLNRSSSKNNTIFSSPTSSIQPENHQTGMVEVTKSIATSNSLPNNTKHVHQGDISSQNTQGAIVLTKRKRGWPRGKPRGPKAKKGKVSSKLAKSIQKTTNNLPNHKSNSINISPRSNDSLGIAVKKISKKTNDSEVSPRPNVPTAKYDSKSLSNIPAHSEADNTSSKDTVSQGKTIENTFNDKVLGESLMQQIRMAIEASLPSTIDKDAITKSVDVAVQNYLDNMNKTQQEDFGNKILTQASSTLSEKQSGSRAQVFTSVSPKLNADKHPKKVWACKHQDTEVIKTSDIVPVTPKKRPGRPRKNPLNVSSDSAQGTHQVSQTSLQKESFSDISQGKVPTTSATVIPRKGIISAIRPQSKRLKPTARKLVARARSDITRRTASNLPAPFHNEPMSKEDALVSLKAISSSKAVKMKLVKGYLSDFEPGLYSESDVEDHMKEIINITVEMYTWDVYKEFEKACFEVEREMGFMDDSDLGKPKNLAVKKSIESVVEKLKNKQAQNIHSVATVLLELHDAPNDDRTQEFENVSDEEINSHERSILKKSSNQNINKVKKNDNLARTVSIKRPRGRPRRIVEGETPVKKMKILSEDKKKRKLEKEEKKQAKNKHHKQVKISATNTSKEESNPQISTKKPVLQAGLYSSTFKKNQKSSISSAKDPANLSPKLPPPYDAGLYFRSTLKDFQLPYDVWWMYKHKKITVSQNPSTSFVKITKNIYTGSRPSVDASDQICTCNPDMKEACGKECLNRSMLFECQPSSCPCGSRCTNQVIQKGSWYNGLERFKTKDRGWGIRSNGRINKGSFILEYVGEVLSEAEFRIRTIELYHAYNDHFCVQLDATTVIDGYRMANEGRFVNHSCEPNCEMQKWCVNGEYRIGLFALRQIQLNEELTYDYNFHAYDIDARQVCRCGSQHCRGFIGGRDQCSLASINNNEDLSSAQPSVSVKSAKLGLKRTKGASRHTKDDDIGTKEFSILQMKPISKQDKEFIRFRQLFLLRNLTQVKKKEEQLMKVKKNESDDSSAMSSSNTKSKSKLKKTQHSKEESEKIEAALTEMYTAIATCKDQNGVSVAIPFMNLPSKKKNPEYYERISDPIDLSVIERNIVSNHYKDIETFNSDVQRVFKNAEKYHGRKSTLGKDVSRLRKAYANARGAAMLLLNGHKKVAASSELSSEEDIDEADEHIHRKNEDHIRCICGIYKDEGLMVQCEKCYVWQHCDCMGVKPGNTDCYMCEECDPRPFSREIKVIPPPPHTPTGHTFYMTLLRDNLLVKQGDCAYLMRDHRLRQNSNTLSMRASNRKLTNIPQDKLDIFRIEQLWTDERGDKYAYGHHFLRPHETHHSPSRTFYHNELFASPFNEIIPLEAVVGLCCVMDLYTYCKGKPKDYKMSDIFICDFRVDKAAGLFTRITKKRFPICTKPHVFDMYKHRICPKKNFQPHQVPEHYKKSSGRPPSNTESLHEDVQTIDSEYCHVNNNETEHEDDNRDEIHVGSSIWRKRQRLNRIAHQLLSKQADVSYSVEPGNTKRQRKKSQLSV